MNVPSFHRMKIYLPRMLLLYLRFAISANPPGHVLPVQKKVYGRAHTKRYVRSSDEIALNFKEDGVYYYSKDQIAIFDTIASVLDETAQDDYSIDIPDFISKQDLDSFLNIFEVDPAIHIMDPRVLAHTLIMADYLGIKDDRRSSDFFSHVCKHSILGTHRINILSTRLYILQPKLTRGCRTYTHLAQAFACMHRLQLSIFEEGKDDPVRALVFHTPEYVKKHRVLGLGARINKIKITSLAQKKAPADILDIIIWLFDHISASSLDLSGCFISKDHISKIACLQSLQILDLSDCLLSANSLLPIGLSPVLRNGLLELYADNNRLSFGDVDALGLLAALKTLRMRYCHLSPGHLVPIGRSPTLRLVLRELQVCHNRFCPNDIEALSLLTTLEVLRLSDCELPPGSLVPIGDSPKLRKTLHELHADDNIFDSRDTGALALLTTLNVVNLSNCRLSPGSLVPIGTSPRLKKTLLELDADENKFGFRDTRALALLTALKTLSLSDCGLPPNSLVPIGKSEELQSTLLQLYADDNVFGSQDTGAIALLIVLQVLSLKGCSLQPGSLVPIGKSRTLQLTLLELYVDYNAFCSKDTKALALLTTLKVLSLSNCELFPGSLAFIGRSPKLKKTLRELDADENTLGFRDTRALARLAVLEILSLSDCGLPPNSLVPIGNSELLQGILHELHADENTFSSHDTEALSLLTALQVLSLSRCQLPPNSLVPIDNSKTFQGVLCELHVGDNTFDLEDTAALSSLTTLHVLNLSNCSLPPNSLVPIGFSRTLQLSLHELRADENTFCLHDTEALSLLITLQVLSLSLCQLPPDSLVPIGNSKTLQCVLRELDVSLNRAISINDTKALSLLAALQVLNLGHCSLPQNSLFPICNSPTLKSVLHELDLSNNKINPWDTSAIACLTVLRVLKLRYCNLLPGSLVPIYNRLIIPRILRRLDVTGNQSLGPKDKTIIAEHNRLINFLHRS